MDADSTTITKACCWVMAFMALLTLCQEKVQAQNFVTMEERHFMLDGQEFYPRVMNYSIQIACNTMNDATPADLYITPEHGYDSNIYGYFESTDPTFLRNQLHEHFAKIAEMHFNTVRLGVRPFMRRESPNGPRHYSIEVQHNVNSYTPDPTRYLLDLDAPQFTGPLSTRLFELIDVVLEEADATGLKVILICADDYTAGGDDQQLTLATDQAAVDLYAAYLSKLAAAVHDKPALLAFDLWNEPIWTNYDLMNCSKNEICSFTTTWYDAIRAQDPHHLITLGGASYHELSAWDPAAMKLDFYSPHVYPFPSPIDNYDLPNTYERYKAELYWLGSVCPMPWLIGETAFSAEDDVFDPLDAFTGPDNQHLDGLPAHHKMPWMNGSEQDQSDFLTISMDATRNYLGSGYSWWAFQDDRLTNLNSHAGDYLGNWFAPLKFGNDANLGLPAPWNVLNHWRDKVMVSTLENYVLPPAPTSLPTPPPAYYNWFNLSDDDIAFTGSINDEDNHPIVNGTAEIHWLYNFQGNDEDVFDYHLWDVVPTDEDGHYTLRTPPTIDGYDPPQIKGLSLNALGAQHAAYGFLINSWPTTATLAAVVADPTADIDGESVTSGSHADWYAGYALTVTNTTISGVNASADLHARHEVVAGPEFHAASGSYVHLYINNECYPIVQSPMQPGGPQILSAGIRKQEREKESGHMVLHFQVAEASITAFPDPCIDQIHLTTDLDGSKVCTVFDGHGHLVFQGAMPGSELDFTTTALASGAYVVRISNAHKSCATTFIKQP